LAVAHRRFERFHNQELTPTRQFSTNLATPPAEQLEILSYENATVALRALFEFERDHPGLDIVLVKGDRPEDVRLAFKNYFSDARQFIYLIEAGCQKL